MGELTAKKDQSLSGWDIRYLVLFWLEPDSRKWLDIRPTGTRTGNLVHPKFLPSRLWWAGLKSMQVYTPGLKTPSYWSHL